MSDWPARLALAVACLVAAVAAGVVVTRSGDGPAAVVLVRCPPPAAPATGAGQSPARAGGSPAAVEIRVNQVGYVAGCPKLALVMARRPLTAGFTLLSGSRVALQGRLGPSRGAWSRVWPYVYPIDLSAARASGRYTLAVAGATSPSFAIGSAPRLYATPMTNAVGFFTAQRDGPQVAPGPFPRVPSHLLDRSARVYAQPSYRGLTLTAPLRPTGVTIDASGGWFDAGDYLKFVETASFADVLQLLALRDYSASPALRAEARFGLDWLTKMWDPRRRVLYYQVGIGDGNGGSVLGDHDLWRLPQADDHRSPRPADPAYYVSHRPVFAANAPGAPISPNLAGRVAAALGLCAQVFAHDDPARAAGCLRDGQTIYALADTHPRVPLTTTSPRGYYSETEWRDDMELGAIELYLGGRALGRGYPPRTDVDLYLNDAGRWADAYISSKAEGSDSLNLYDVSALAHYDLYRVMTSKAYADLQKIPQNGIDLPTDPPSLLQDYSDQLALATRLGRVQPFGLSNPSTNLDTVPHALGYSIQARLYDRLIGRPTFDGLASTQLDWVLGENAWGSSFVVGSGSTYPRCPAAPLANLTSGATFVGATVDGPSDPGSLGQRSAPDGYRRCPAAGGDPWAAFDGSGMAYLDDATSFTTSEPGDDFAALALLAFAIQAHQG
ncbi:MAG: glycoside hydrolase family 9 protein [Solirubrobacteraceae bacterium]